MGTLDNCNTVLDKTGKGDLYKNNLEALRIHHPDLADMMDSLSIEEGKIKVIDSESGHPRVLYKKSDGEEVYIHNADDPTKCAVQASELLGQMESEGIAVMLGFGLGYIADELLRRFEKGHILMVYEATPDLFKTAMQTRDLTSLFNSGKVKIMLGVGDQDISLIHTHHHLLANGKFWALKHHPSAKLNEKAYDIFFEKLNDEKRLSDSGVATAIGMGKEFINSFLENIPYILRSHGVRKLKDIFKGRPAIVVSAGPSLDKNLHLIEKARGRAIIIAVDAVLPTLLPCGIIPDLVVAIDPVKYNNIMFKDIPVLKEVPFICLAQYTPEIVRMYPGYTFFNGVSMNIAYQWLSRFWEDKGHIECFGGSVAHFAFAVAEFLGSSSIAFLGQNLSFMPEKTHTSAFSGLVQKQFEMEVRQGNKEVRSQLLGAEPTKDIFGEEVLTRGDFLSFRTSFENRIRNYSGVVVNATEGGLPIAGTVAIRFVDFIDKYCSNMSEIEPWSVLSKLRDNEPDFNLEGLLSEVREARDKFTEIRKKSSSILRNIKKLKKLKGRGQKESSEFCNILDNVEEDIEHVKHPLLNLMTGYHYSLELFLKRQDMQEVDDIEDKWEKLDKQLDRGLHYYNELNSAIYLFNKRLNSLINSLEVESKVSSTLSDEILGQDRFYRAGMIYKKSGMTVHAVRCLEKGVRSKESGVKNQKGLLQLAEMYLEQFRFYEAREILEKIKDRCSASSDQDKTAKHVHDQLKVCNEKIRAWKERTQKTAKMLEKAETHYGGHLESGYFYFRVQDFKRAEEQYQQAVTDGESSGMLKDLIEAYYGLAHTYLALEDSEKAVEVFEKAIKADPGNPLIYRDLGLIAYQNNNIEPAEIFFSKAIELAPQDAELYKPLADLYMSLGERDKAVALYEHALESNADDPLLQKGLARMYHETIANVDAG